MIYQTSAANLGIYFHICKEKSNKSYFLIFNLQHLYHFLQSLKIEGADLDVEYIALGGNEFVGRIAGDMEKLS